MAIRTYKVTLDSKNTIAPEPVYLRQGDKTGAVVIDATLMDNGSPVSLSGLTPMFKANTADGQAVIADSTGFTVTDSANGKFTYQVPNALSATPGKITTAYFSLSDADGSESTFDVAFIIKAAVDISQGQAEDYITIIDGTLNSLQKKIDDINTDIKTVLNAYNQGDFYNKSETDSKYAEVTAQLQQTEQSLNAQLAQTSAQVDLLNRGLGETFATLVDLQTAFPTGDTKDHIVASDGHRYYWSGSAWADGGVYQAVDILDKQVSANKLDATLQSALGIKSYKNMGYDLLAGNNTFTLTATGSIQTIGFFGRYANPLQVKAGKRYLVAFKIAEINPENTATTYGISVLFRKLSDNSNFGTVVENSASSVAQIEQGNYYGYATIDVPSNASAYIYMLGTSLTTGQVLSFTLDKLAVFELEGTDKMDYLDKFKTLSYRDYYNTTPLIESRITEIENALDVGNTAIESRITEIENALDVGNTAITAWGDSLTYGAGGNGTTYTSVLETLTGRSVTNYGVGGETSATIMSRQGSLPMMVNPFTIPATATAVTVDFKSSNGETIAPLLQATAYEKGINPCTIGGVEGTLTYDTGNLIYKFTRSVGGTETVISRPTPIVTHAMKNHKNDGVLLIWIGTNDCDYSPANYTDAFYDKLIAKINLMLEYADCSKFIVLGFISNKLSDWTDLNYKLSNTFGRHFINIHKYLVDYGLQDAGITPTTQDTTDVSNGRVPVSLRSDGLHLNASGYTVLGQKMNERGLELGYW